LIVTIEIQNKTISLLQKAPDFHHKIVYIRQISHQPLDKFPIRWASQPPQNLGDEVTKRVTMVKDDQAVTPCAFHWLLRTSIWNHGLEQCVHTFKRSNNIDVSVVPVDMPVEALFDNVPTALHLLMAAQVAAIPRISIDFLILTVICYIYMLYMLCAVIHGQSHYMHEHRRSNKRVHCWVKTVVPQRVMHCQPVTLTMRYD
jgi:hypothetical protein